jgi:hypothetical protein
MTGEQLSGPAWLTQHHDVYSLPVLARPGSVIPFGAVSDGPEYAWAEGVQLRLFAPAEGQSTVLRIPDEAGRLAAQFDVLQRGCWLGSTCRRLVNSLQLCHFRTSMTARWCRSVAGRAWRATHPTDQGWRAGPAGEPFQESSIVSHGFAGWVSTSRRPASPRRPGV